MSFHLKKIADPEISKTWEKIFFIIISVPSEQLFSVIFSHIIKNNGDILNDQVRGNTLYIEEREPLLWDTEIILDKY